MNESQLFAQALHLSGKERAAYLDQACADHPELRAELDELLAIHDQDPEFLEQPAEAGDPAVVVTQAVTGDTTPEVEADDLAFLSPPEGPESLGRLGHYEIQQVVGRGGMGIVFKAFDTRLHRVVAIKVMIAQLAANATARRRFKRE